MKLLASLQVRLFLTCWLVYGLFFATNVVREHYPAFTLIDQGDWVCDRYAGYHADIFQHTDGHWYVGNNVLGSLIAAVPLAVFDPVLDALESYSKRKLAESPTPPDTTYDTKYPIRQEMFRKVKLAGLDLRFGASAAITSLFLMAPLSAALVVLMYRVLLARGLARSKVLWLSILFAFATPVFYRTAHLNHNMFLMEALFAAFVLLWVRPEQHFPVSTRNRALAGFLCGVALALDYAGLIPAAVLTAYLVVPRARTIGWARSLRESVPFVLAAIPPVLFLLGTQWAMYGNPFTPGQFVMRDVNYTDKGMRGVGWPSMEVFLKNLISPSWGLLTFAPLLVLGFVPATSYKQNELVFPARERMWSALFVLSFLLFCAANWYSLMQFNTGFRYLLPVVPFVFLAASDHLARLPKKWLAAISIVVLAHSAILCMTREVNDTEKNLRDAAEQLGIARTEVPGYWKSVLTETPVPLSYRRVFYAAPNPEDAQGLQLPWLTVLRQTTPSQAALLGSPLLVLGLFAACALAIWALWTQGARRERFVSEILPSTAS